MKGDPRSVTRTAAIEKRWNTVEDIVNDWPEPPMSVRQVFYQTVARGWPKTADHAKAVGRDLWSLRMLGRVPWERIADDTRNIVGGDSSITDYAPEDAVRDHLRDFDGLRVSRWASQPVTVQVWLEKAGLASVVTPVTDAYRVPLLVGRGNASLTLQKTAYDMLDRARPNRVLMLFDLDTSGQTMDADTKEKFDYWQDVYGESIDVEYLRVAVTPEQVRRLSLPTRPDKVRAGATAVELDAMSPADLRAELTSVIESVIDRGLWDDAEALERGRVAESRAVVAALMEAVR